MSAEPYYSDDLVTLYHGDCLDVLPSLSAVDLVVTSPPYNLGASPGGGFGHWRAGQPRGGYGKWAGASGSGIGYGAHDDAMPPAEYETWQRAVLTACWDTLSDTGAIYYVHKPRVQAETLWLPLTLNPGLPVRQVVIWDRGSGLNYAPTNYVPMHEWITVFAKPAFRLKSKAASGAGDVWRIAPDVGTEHPSPFPVALPGRAIETTAPTLVLDVFAGSGSTLVAAKRQGCKAVGIENHEGYCEIAAKRLSQGVLDFGATA